MNRRDMLRRLAIGASGLVVAESVRDFMAWEAKRIFALGGVAPAVPLGFMDITITHSLHGLNGSTWKYWGVVR